MQDSIFDYPDQVKLKPRNQPIAEEKKIIIKNNAKLPQQMTRFYERNTFDYGVMLVGASHNFNQHFNCSIKTKHINQVNEYLPNHKKKQEQKKPIQEDKWMSQQQDQQEKEIFKNNYNYNQKQIGMLDNVRNQRNDQKNQYMLPKFLGEKHSQQAASEEQIQNTDNQQKRKFKQLSSHIESSQISMLHQMKKQIIYLQQQQQNQQQLNQVQVDQQMQSNQSLDDQQIKQIIDNLQKQQVNQQQLKLKQQRQQKLKQIQSVPYKNLVYYVKAQNCSRIYIKYVTDLLGNQVKSKTIKNTEYSKLSNLKLVHRCENPNNLIRWVVGKSKVKIFPLGLMTTCLVCKTKQNKGIIDKQNYYLKICVNRNCNKSMTVQIIKAQLQQQ